MITMRLVIASNNDKKRQEIARLFDFPQLSIVSAADTVHVDVVEDGDSFAANARKKAEAFAKANGCAALADDSGLCVDALDGAPGIYSARFAGESCDDAANHAHLLRCLADKENRDAHFICHVCLLIPENGVCLSAEGRSDGRILEQRVGEQGFGYDPLFFSTELGKGFAVVDAAEKASVSHRGRALRLLYAQLQRYLKTATS